MRTHSVFTLFLILFYTNFSVAIDSFSSSQSISGNTTLESAQGKFRLGFFSPANSKNSYLGIWFNNIPNQTVVWVANRDNPIHESTGILKFGDDGNLILVDQTERIFWSSNTTSSNVNNTVVQLLETGNLVVRDIEKIDSFIWQSFDHPCDTMLEKMKIGLDLETGMNRQLTSWENPNDPSSGQYTHGFNVRGIPQLVILRNGYGKIFRSGLWNGVLFSGILLAPNFVYGAKIVINDKEVYYEHDLYNQSAVTMLRLSYSGATERLVWDDINLEWSVVHSLPRDRCDEYNFCGPNAFCDVNMRDSCNCLTGYEPRSPQDWDVFIRSGGCIRRDPLNCTNGEGFVELVGMKMPDLIRYWKNPNMTLDDCRKECLKNCTCTAYTSLDVTREKPGCLLWFDELVDIRRLIDNVNWTLYLRVSASDLSYKDPSVDSENNKKVVMLALSITASIVVLILVAFCIMWKRGKICGKRSDILRATDEEIQNLSIFSLATIAEATRGFSFSNWIGEGGFGPVFKGTLSSGVEIAVKRLALTSGQGVNEFKNEVTFIAKLQHKNLVRLLGCCIQGDEKMLVYEYMSNGSLDSFIFDDARSNFLDWRKRYDIIIGIARGLLYLHRDSRLRIIHRDLKTSNILLDSEMNPKISDFGTARVFGADQCLAKTNRVIGTYGYMSPEYAIDGVFSVKSDVFSFGVLVLEIISGKRNRQFRHPDHDLNLLGHAWKLWSEGKAFELLDPVMVDSVSFLEVAKCVQVGLLCVQHRPEDRPTMSYVLSLLDNASVMLPQPKHPGFYIERISDEDEIGEHDERYSITNVLTDTLSEGR